MKLTLTAAEGNKMVEAFYNVALSHGWDIDELEDANILPEYGAAVDAALAAIGITVEIMTEDEDEDEDEEDSDSDSESESENTEEYHLTPKGRFVLMCVDNGYSIDHAFEVANKLFGGE